MVYNIFFSLFSFPAIFFFSIYLTAVLAAIMIPLKYIFNQLITFKLLAFSYFCLFIFFYSCAFFFEQLFVFTFFIDGYLILFGVLFLFSFFNVYILGKNINTQFIVTVTTFLSSIWLYIVLLLSLSLSSRFNWPILWLFVFLMLAFIPVMIGLYHFILKKIHVISVTKTVIVTLLYVLFFAVNNIWNIMVIGFSPDSLRILISETYPYKERIQQLAPDAVLVPYNLKEVILLAVIFFCITLIPLVYIIRLLIVEELGKKRIEEQKEREKELYSYINIIESFNEELRKIQHDYKNILATLAGYIYNEEVDISGLRKNYEEIMASLDIKKFDFVHFSKIKNIDSLEIVSILLAKIVRANDAGVILSLEIVEPVYFQQREIMKLTRILGILLDNAIEGALECENPKIDIAFIQMEASTVIHIQNNTVNRQLIRQLTTQAKNFSTKGKNRGLGLGIVYELIDGTEQLSLSFEQKADIISFRLLVDCEKEI